MRDFFEKIYNFTQTDGLFPWLAIIVGFRIFVPLGLFGLLMKLNVITPALFSGERRTTTGTKPVTADQRKKVYMDISRGATSISIDYLSSAVGADFTTTMRDVQEMVIDGVFGSQAYIDYGLRRLILTAGATEAQASPNRATTAKAHTAAKPKQAEKQTVENKRKEDKKAPEKSGTKYLGLLIGGIIMLALGGLIAIDSIEAIALLQGSASAESFSDLIMSICFMITGGSMLGLRSFKKKRARRIASYLPIIGDRASISISELGSAAGVKESTVKKDLHIMLEDGLLPKGAYLDNGAGKLIIRHSEEHHQNEEVKTEETENSGDRYRAIIMEIRQLNDEIADEAVSAKIDEIEELTAKIFKVVQDKPEKLPEIKSFMSYYLPTTLKLLRSYRDFENQGVSGENIDATKERIEKILDTLSSGFSQQLDQLFKSDAIDISSDIDVLETMMRRDGLSKDESGFQVGV